MAEEDKNNTGLRPEEAESQVLREGELFVGASLADILPAEEPC